MTKTETVAAGRDGSASVGDVVFCHRRGLVSALIRWGERLRAPRGAHWSHVAICVSPTEIVEALTHGVTRNPLSAYRDVEYLLVHTGLDVEDRRQAKMFADSCVGQRYGFAVILGIVLRFLTPGRGLWFGMDGTEICSGLAAQALCRGWYNFSVSPASITPAELVDELLKENSGKAPA